jgi:hypothetical protein
VIVIDGDAVGVTSGAVVEADVQAAAMSRPTLIVVASRECDECIPCPSDGVRVETFGSARCCGHEPDAVPTRRRPHLIAPAAAGSLKLTCTVLSQ